MTNAPYPIVPVPGEKDWLDRHPRRRMWLGGIILIGCMVVFVGGVLSLVEYSFHHHTVTLQAVERVENNPQVVLAIGQPMQVGWVIKGNIHMKNSNGYADLRIPISGADGKGTIVLYAKETLGIWTFTILRVDLADSTTIDLM